MRTTVRLDDELLEQAQREAGRRGDTVSDLVREGLLLVLAASRPGEERGRLQLPVSPCSGGVWPGVNLDRAR